MTSEIIRELKTELANQKRLVGKLRAFRHEVAKGGYEPLNPLDALIAGWEESIVSLEKRIQVLEQAS